MLGVLVCLVTIYNIVLYTQDTDRSSAPLMSESAMKGEHLWQSNNCTACHQLYGLGGYLGPDLTNIISNPTKGREYAKAFFNSGVKSMPEFNFSEEQKESIVAFLEHVDRTGIYPNTNAEFGYSGWVAIEYK